MNERIRELVEQAEKLADDELAHLERVHNRLYSFTEGREIYNQKFAELIVQECILAIINDRRLNDVRSAANGCVRTINEHFGVEE